MTDGNVTKPKDMKQYEAEIDKFCEEYLVKKAPFAIPENWKEILVKVIAWVNVIRIVMALLALPVLLGLGALIGVLDVASGATINPLSNIWGILSLVFTLASLVLYILAAKGLFARKAQAWRLIFYAQLLSVVQSLVAGQLVSMIIGLVIGMYVLYQMRDKYVN